MNFFRRILTFLGIALRRLPITTLLLLAAGGLFALRLTVPLFDTSIDPRHYFPGALEPLALVHYPEVHGYFQLWKGEWWRILVSCLHHFNVLHLVMNSLYIWPCAAVLEPRLGKLGYFLFLLSSALVSSLFEMTIESYFVGLSGVAYALFGALLMLRRVDPQVARFVTPSFVWSGFAWLFLCIVLTLLKLAPIANGAHLGGLVYGVFVGWQVFVVGRRRRWTATAMFGATHGLVVLAILMAMSPIQRGSYFSWKATNSSGLEAQLYWHQATKLDPRQVLAWSQQIDHSIQQREWMAAWSLTLNAAKANRSENAFIEAARQLWSEIKNSAQTAQAEATLDRVFGPESAAWRERIFGPQPGSIADANRPGASISIDGELPAPTLSIKINVDNDLPNFTRPGNAKGIGEVDPEDPRSALFGETL